MLLILLLIGAACFGNSEVNALCQVGSDNGQKALRSTLSESDTYQDLNTGKVFKVMYDDLNEKYDRVDLFALDLYVNTRTKDTFWLEEPVLVNHALRRDGAVYRVDPMKVKRDGNGYKVINNNGPSSTTGGAKEDKKKEGEVSAF